MKFAFFSIIGFCLIALDARGREDLCQPRLESKIVRGVSMKGVYNNGAEIKVDSRFYTCHEVKRHDVVVIKKDLRAGQMIKMVHVLPGDRFELVEKKGYYGLLVNGMILKTPLGIDYKFFGKSYKMIRLYEKSFEKLMPVNTYFVFGTNHLGSKDSSSFGPITSNMIAGKVVP